MKTIIIKNNGVVSVSNKLLSDLKKEGLLYGKHLCFSNGGICKNALANKCPKIAEDDYNKKNIANYDFITDGYQVNKSNGELDRLVVTGCQNYVDERESVVRRPLEEAMEIDRKKLSIMLSYFDADSVSEINSIIEHNNRIK